MLLVSSQKNNLRGKKMTKRLLLVDDEKFFLEGLKESLSKYKNTFATDICFSVQEAIALYKQNHYELIISDIRMPKESGLDLFVYLKDQDYHGDFIAMTAYGSPEVLDKIKSLGVLDVILKPFNLSWFTEKVLDIFEEEEGVSGTIESFALTSLLQMINLERKTLTVKVENQTSVGFLYFAKGEIVHAEYQEETGEEAAFQLIKLKRGRFSLLSPEEKKRDKKTIDTPFMVLMMNVMKTADENQKKQHFSI
jgi:YesN/AraC family two-component response regulator